MPDRPQILLVDDDPGITDNLAPLLERAGYAVDVAADGREALARLGVADHDLVILDVLMPGPDGREVLRRIRSGGDGPAVILLTQVGESVERAMALNEGADDYLNKPFDPTELLARIGAVLRRAQRGQQPVATAARIRSGRLVVDRSAHRVFLGDRELALTPKAVVLLVFLMTHADELLTRERLLDAVWGWSFPTSTRTIDTRIAELRRALGDDAAQPTCIETVPSQGYRWIAPVEGG